MSQVTLWSGVEITADPEAAIGTYIDGCIDRAHSFTWIKSADEIIAHAKPSVTTRRLTTRDTSHGANINPRHFAASAVGSYRHESRPHRAHPSNVEEGYGRLRR